MFGWEWGGEPGNPSNASEARDRKRTQDLRSTQGLVEPVHGWIKSMLGFRQFSMRGLAKAAGEWTMVCLALNLRQLNLRMEWN